MPKAKKCYMCDPNQYKVVDTNVSIDRLLEDKEKYYVIIPREPQLFCHLLIVLKADPKTGKYRRGLVAANRSDLTVLIEPVIKWTKILRCAIKDCDRVYLACISDRPHLHYHLFPVRKKDKPKPGSGLKWLGDREACTEMKRFDQCSLSEKQARGEYIRSIFKFLKKAEKQFGGTGS